MSQAVDFEKFKAELIALCEKHGVQLATSGYDSLDVWRLQPGDEILYSGLVDMTQPQGEK